MECATEQMRATLLDAGLGELLEHTRAVGSRWRELETLISGRARLASELLDWLSNTQQLHRELDYLLERHGFKIWGAKASKLLKIYCKFKKFVDFL